MYNAKNKYTITFRTTDKALIVMLTFTDKPKILPAAHAKVKGVKPFCPYFDTPLSSTLTVSNQTDLQFNKFIRADVHKKISIGFENLYVLFIFLYIYLHFIYILYTR